MQLKSRLSSQDSSVVKKTIQSFIDSWNSKNLTSFGELFTDDAEFTDVMGQTAIGKEAVVKQHILPLESVMKEAILEMKDAYARPLSDQLILVSAMWKVEKSMTPDFRPSPTRHGVVQIVLERNNEAFLIKLVHNSDNALPYERQERIIENNNPL